MSRACPGGCGRKLADDNVNIACRPCWFSVPKTLRDALWSHPAHSPGRREAAADVYRWFASRHEARS